MGIGVENMGSMFKNCLKLKDVSILSYWNFSNVERMNNMFANCKELEILCDFKNALNVIDTSFMFENCEALMSLPNNFEFDPKKQIDMYYMFNNCKQLIKEDISTKFEKYDKAEKTDISNGCQSKNNCCYVI